MTPDGAATFLATWGYTAYLALFFASAFGSPLTEDLLLLVGGYLVGTGVFTWPLTALLSYVGIVGTDTLLYVFGRRLRRHTLRRGAVRRFIRPGRLRASTRWFARFGDRVVFLARLVPGTRIVVFVSAGVRGMPLMRFLAYDAAAAVLWVPALLAIGMTVGEHIGGVQAVLRWVGHRVTWVILGAVVVLVLRQFWLVRAQRRTGDDETL